MALPSLTKTWQFNVNNAIAAQGTALADNKAVLLAIKNALIGFGTNPWVVKYSCDSVTAGTAGDGVDRWSTVANLVWNAAGSAHSWMVLQQSGVNTGFQIMLSCSGASAGGQTLTSKMSSSAGFTGGTTTADPTATDSQNLFNTTWSNVSTDAATRWSVSQSTDGQCTRWWVFSGGALTSFLQIEKLANATGGTPGASNTGWSQVASQPSGLTMAGNTRQNGTNCATVLSYESASNLGIASEVSGSWDIFPIGIASTATVGTRGKLGTLQDMWITSSGIATGDTFPATGSPAAQFVVIQGASVGLVFPWNNGAVNLT